MTVQFTDFTGQDKFKAVFTDFTSDSNWVNGECNEYWFEAKLFDEGSMFGINEGRVSKLHITEKNNRDNSIVEYDRGWGKGKTLKNSTHKKVFESIMNLLENSPKRFE